MIITESNSNLLNHVRKQFGFAQINTITDTQNNSVVEKPIINNILENIAQKYQHNTICYKYLENENVDPHETLYVLCDMYICIISI